MIDDEDDDAGGYRSGDPDTSKDAAKSISASGLQFLVLKWLHYLHPLPQNGWELSLRMKLPTTSVVPRLAPLRRMGLILKQGTRPGPTGRAQGAYVLTPRGGVIVELFTKPVAPAAGAANVPP